MRIFLLPTFQFLGYSYAEMKIERALELNEQSQQVIHDYVMEKIGELGPVAAAQVLGRSKGWVNDAHKGRRNVKIETLREWAVIFLAASEG